MQLNDFNIFTVGTLEEFKELEQKLFSVELKDETHVTVICEATNKLYYYKSAYILGELRLITDGEADIEQFRNE